MSPSLETLRAVLRLQNHPEKMVDLCLAGFLPREINSPWMLLWRVRDTFYRLADLAISERTVLTFEDFFRKEFFIVNSGVCGNSVVDGSMLRSTVNWRDYPSPVGCFPWPIIIIYFQQLATIYWIYVLYSIWCLDTRLIETDLSSAIGGFTPENRQLIVDLISASTPVDAPREKNFQKIRDLLRGGPLSRRELERKLGVKRGTLLSRFIDPALEAGLIKPTEKGSSPKQRYRLVSERR